MPLMIHQRGLSCIVPTFDGRISNARSLSYWSRLKNWVTVVATDYGDTPKGIREHKDLAMALLAHTHRRLRLQHPEKSVSTLLDDAITELEDRGMEELGVRATRYELQQELAPEIVKILQTFQKVDEIRSNGENDDQNSILLQEFQDSLVHMTHPAEKSCEHPGSEPFLRRKLGALQTLLKFRGLNVPDDAQSNQAVETNDESDDFGYFADGAEKGIVNAIRQHQTQNLIRSALTRRELGHSVVALKSIIPGAGRGVFIDGEAIEGSLVAFVPGEVLPKEYLIDRPASLNEYLSHDPKFLLSLRSDDILIDSRQSPYTVLDEDGSNPWAIGHIINHPPPGVIPNCRTVMINFTEPMALKENGLLRYIPNSYKRKPMFFGPKLFDRETVIMHGMGIMTRRDVSNEELFYDYKFEGDDDSHPSWYHLAVYEDWADERDY